MKRSLFVTASTVMIVVVLTACGTSSTGTPTPATSSAPTATATAPTATTAPTTTTTVATSATAPTSTPAATPDTAALDAAISGIVQAMRDRDMTRMRDFMGDQLRQQLRDQDMQHLMSCIPSGTTVTLVDRSVEVTGDTAKVTITFSVTTAAGTPTTVERVWEFARQPDGTWTLVSTPECPFQ